MHVSKLHGRCAVTQCPACIAIYGAIKPKQSLLGYDSPVNTRIANVVSLGAAMACSSIPHAAHHGGCNHA